MANTRELGSTGLKVFPIGLGGMPMSIQGRPDEKQSIATIHAAIDAGVNFIDTANVYCLDNDDIGHNERLIAKALREKKVFDKVIIATKGGLARPKGDWTVDGRPEFIRKSCELSLKALGVEAITLYQLHSPDPNVRYQDTIAELAKMKVEGKIIHVGLSNVSEDQLDLAQKIVRIESVQNRCHPLFQRDYKSGLIAHCAKQKVSYLPWSPVGGGRTHASVAQHSPLPELAKKYNTSAYGVILAWHLGKGANVIPIPGASKGSSISDSAKAVNVTLDPKDSALIDQLT